MAKWEKGGGGTVDIENVGRRGLHVPQLDRTSGSTRLEYQP